MLGAIIGDIAGSFREFSKNKYPEVGLLPTHKELNAIIPNVRYGITDDSVLTFATAYTCLRLRDKKTGAVTPESFASLYYSFGNHYAEPIGGYGGGFVNWLSGSGKEPYNSCGNGSAMRVSPVAYVGANLTEVRNLAFNSACATHNHPEGIKGAQVTAIMIYLARQGKNIKQIVDELYDMKLHYEPVAQLDHFDAICQDTMRLAMFVLLTTTNFHDAVLKAVTIPKADSDTLGAIVGAVAEALYGIPDDIKEHALTFVYDKDLRAVYDDFVETYISIDNNK